MLAPAEVVGRADTTIHDLAYDARAADSGSLFFCVPGERADGHDFAAEAIRNGAVALVVQHPLDVRYRSSSSPTRAPRWRWSRTSSSGGRRRSWPSPASRARRARRRRRSFSTRCWRRPGAGPDCWGRSRLVSTASGAPPPGRPRRRSTSSGSSARCSTRAIAAARWRRPRTARRCSRLDRVRFAVLVFTNLDRDHLDFHRDMEDYFDAKRRLFLGDDAPPAAVNVGDAYGRRLADELRAHGTPLLTFGLDRRRRRPPWNLPASHVRLLGRFNFENALRRGRRCPPAGDRRGGDRAWDRLRRRRPRPLPVRGRGPGLRRDRDYAHKPGALEQCSAYRARAHGRSPDLRVRLRGDRDRGKRPVMGGSFSTSRTSPSSRRDNPRSEDPLAIVGEIARRDGRRAGRARPTAREPSSRRSSWRGPATWSSSPERGTSAARRSQAIVTPFDDTEVAGEALRALKTTA